MRHPGQTLTPSAPKASTLAPLVGLACLALAGLLLAAPLQAAETPQVAARFDEGDISLRASGGYSAGERRMATPVTNATYAEECAACHMAYQPELMSEATLKLIFDDLTDHFGDDASVIPELDQEMAAYAMAHSANKASTTWARRVKTETTKRISEYNVFTHDHDEVNPDTLEKAGGSIAQCDACHMTAAQGDYNERGLLLPGQRPRR